jgi:hypothetical protein
VGGREEGSKGGSARERESERKARESNLLAGETHLSSAPSSVSPLAVMTVSLSRETRARAGMWLGSSVKPPRGSLIGWPPQPLCTIGWIPLPVNCTARYRISAFERMSAYILVSVCQGEASHGTPGHADCRVPPAPFLGRASTGASTLPTVSMSWGARRQRLAMRTRGREPARVCKREERRRRV